MRRDRRAVRPTRPSSRAAWAAIFCLLALAPRPASAIFELEALDLPGESYDVVVAGDVAYVAGFRSGLQIVRLSQDPEVGSVLVDVITEPREATGLALQGDLLVVVDFGTALYVYDVSEPEQPVETDVVTLDHAPSRVVLEGRYAYVADFERGLRIVDVWNPYLARELRPGSPEDEVPDRGCARDVAVAGSLVYTLCEGIEVWDVSEPEIPVRVTDHPFTGCGLGNFCDQGIAVAGSRLYTSSRYSQLRRFDLSDPAAPAALTGYSQLVDGRTVAVEGDRIYVGEGGLGLRVLNDSADDEAPTDFAILDPGGKVHGLTVRNAIAYIAAGNAGLHIVDARLPTCRDGFDNDGDGGIDYEPPPGSDSDDGCAFPDDLSEAAVCDDGFDNDRDGDVDVDDPGCASALDSDQSERTLTNCDDGADNDRDGLVDAEVDPGCDDVFDDSEWAAHLECDDGVDNDGDGARDFDADPGCSSLAEGVEAPACDDGIDNDGDGLEDRADPGCQSGSDATETSPATICDNGLDDDGDEHVDHPEDPGCADRDDPTESSEVACDNGSDDDRDGRRDYPDDEGCEGPEDDDETSETPCDDGIDNDNDGLEDRADDGCWGVEDLSEEPDCDDGIDNDGDGAIDDVDPSCLPNGPRETSELVCDNGLDDDGDELIDRADPGCLGLANGSSESPVCLNGIDDDSDLAVDFPEDPGCSDPLDDDEQSPSVACDNGLDDDADGRIDFPADPGCRDSKDGAETSPGLVCDDGKDNDGDGKTDYPNDRDCLAPNQGSELPACEDTIDNDGDGSIDEDDPGCDGPGDLSEQILMPGDIVAVRSGSVLKIDPLTGLQTPLAALAELRLLAGVAIAGGSKLYVSDRWADGSHGRVLRLDLEASPVRATVLVEDLTFPGKPSLPLGGGIALVDGAIWLATGEGILSIDPDDGETVLVLEGAPLDLIYGGFLDVTPGPDGRVYATTFSRDGDDGEPRYEVVLLVPGESPKRVSLGGLELPLIHPGGLTLDRTGHVAVAHGPRIELLEADLTKEHEPTVSVCDQIGDIALDPNGELLLVLYCLEGGVMHSQVHRGDGSLLASGFPSTVHGLAIATAACSDGIDNDEDGLVDHPADPECESPGGLFEFAAPFFPVPAPRTLALQTAALLGLAALRRRGR